MFYIKGQISALSSVGLKKQSSFIKAIQNSFTGNASSCQLGKLRSVSQYEKCFILPSLSLSGNILTFSDWKKVFPGILESSETCLKVPLEQNLPNMETLLRFVFLSGRYFVMCGFSGEKNPAVADFFSMEFPVLFLLFWNWLYSIFGEKGKVQKRSDWAQILCFRAWLKTCISPNSCVTRRQVQKAWIICTLSLWEAIFKAERRTVLTSRDKWHIVNSVRHSDTVIMSSIEMPINNTRRCPDTTAYLGK